MSQQISSENLFTITNDFYTLHVKLLQFVRQALKFQCKMYLFKQHFLQKEKMRFSSIISFVFQANKYRFLLLANQKMHQSNKQCKNSLT